MIYYLSTCSRGVFLTFTISKEKEMPNFVEEKPAIECVNCGRFDSTGHPERVPYLCSRCEQKIKELILENKLEEKLRQEGRLRW